MDARSTQAGDSGRLRIAYAIVNHNRREGTSKAVAEVAERMAVQHEVHVFARSAEGVDLDRVRWHRLPGPRYPHVAEFLGYAVQLSFRLRSAGFDIVHAAGAVTTKADVYTIQNIQPAKRKILRALPAENEVSLARRITRWLYLRCTAAWEKRAYERAHPRRPVFLPVSTGVERELRENYAIGDASCKVIPNAADLEKFKPLSVAERAVVRARFQIGVDDFVCAFAGGEWNRKGLDLAIQAIAKIGRKELKLLVLGQDDRMKEFVQMATACKVQAQVIFAGFQARVEEPLAAADVFLFPSRYEAFSLATLEAAACGLPVLAPRINGAEDFIRPGHNGEFVTHDPENVAAIVQRFFDAPEAGRQMGRNGRKMVSENYTWDRVAASTEEIYRELVDARHRRA